MYGGRGPTYITMILISTLIIQTNIYNRAMMSRPKISIAGTARLAATRHPHNLPPAKQALYQTFHWTRAFWATKTSTQPSTGDRLLSSQGHHKTSRCPYRQTPIQSPAQNNVYATRTVMSTSGMIMAAGISAVIINGNLHSNPHSMNSAYQSANEVHRPAEVISRWTMG